MENEFNNGGPAFPHLHSTCQRINQSEYYEGLTVRDYFAGHALVGLLANCIREPSGRLSLNFEEVAESCGALADEMLAERAKPQPEE